MELTSGEVIFIKIALEQIEELASQECDDEMVTAKAMGIIAGKTEILRKYIKLKETEFIKAKEIK